MNSTSEDMMVSQFTTQRPKSKAFQCNGYGDCRMIFTRSEHLARHMRKHTGEKPFKCVIPGCERMFSRFDNMMQHTQTHNKTKGNLKKPMKKKINKSIDSLPSPPISRKNSLVELFHPQIVRYEPYERRHSILELATYLINHPDKSPENYLQDQYPIRRRLSIQDLSNPIDDLPIKDSSDHHGIDLTEDEFQAIQGFGQFYKTVKTNNY